MRCACSARCSTGFGTTEPQRYAPEVLPHLHLDARRRERWRDVRHADGRRRRRREGGHRAIRRRRPIPTTSTGTSRQRKCGTCTTRTCAGRLRRPAAASPCAPATCLYTSTPDAMFRIRAHDVSPSVTVRVGVLGPRLQALGGARRVDRGECARRHAGGVACGVARRKVNPILYKTEHPDRMRYICLPERPPSPPPRRTDSRRSASASGAAQGAEGQRRRRRRGGRHVARHAAAHRARRALGDDGRVHRRRRGRRPRARARRPAGGRPRQARQAALSGPHQARRLSAAEAPGVAAARRRDAAP